MSRLNLNTVPGLSNFQKQWIGRPVPTPSGIVPIYNRPRQIPLIPRKAT